MGLVGGHEDVRPGNTDFGYLSLDGAGAVESMNVLGSAGSPQWFEYRFKNSGPGRDYRLLEAVLSISGGKIDDPANWGGNASPLIEGFEMGWITYQQGIEIDIPVRTFKDNFDLVSFSADSHPWGFTSAAKDVMVVEFFSDYKVVFSPDQIRGIYCIVRDDLTDLDDMKMAVRGYTI